MQSIIIIIIIIRLLNITSSEFSKVSHRSTKTEEAFWIPN